MDELHKLLLEKYVYKIYNKSCDVCKNKNNKNKCAGCDLCDSYFELDDNVLKWIIDFEPKLKEKILNNICWDNIFKGE